MRQANFNPAFLVLSVDCRTPFCFTLGFYNPQILEHIAIFVPQSKTTVLPPYVILSSKSNQFRRLEEVQIYLVRLLNYPTIGVGFNGVETDCGDPTDEQSRIIRYFQLLNNLQFVYFVVQFYPWFQFYYLIITHYHIQKQRKIKFKPYTL